MKRLVLLSSLLLLPSALAAPPGIGYAQATGYFKKDTRPTLYQPLNVLDGREISAWCTQTADPLNDSLRIGFKGVARIDEVRIYTGNGADDTTFQTFSRAKKFSLKTHNAGRTFTVADQRGLQAVTIKPPLEGASLTLEVLDQYPAEDPESPVCLTDVIFYSEGKPLNGPWLTPKLKYDRQRAPLLGTWYAGFEGAPERFLSFFFDGTYRLVYEPIDSGQKARSFSGDYEAGQGGRAVLEVPGKGKATARIKRAEKGGKESGHPTLAFQGSDLPEDFKPAYRDAP